MVKKSLIVASIVLMTGCVERGASIDVKATPSRGITHAQTSKNNDGIPTLVVHRSREDVVQKNISATMILIIGLVLIL